MPKFFSPITKKFQSWKAHFLHFRKNIKRLSADELLRNLWKELFYLFSTFKFCTYVLRISSGDINGEEREEDVEYLLSRWRQNLWPNFANFLLFFSLSLLLTSHHILLQLLPLLCYYYYYYYLCACPSSTNQMISKH